MNPRDKSPLFTTADIAESTHYRVVVTVVEVTGLPERKTKDITSITTTAKDSHTAILHARDYLDMAASHATPPEAE